MTDGAVHAVRIRSNALREIVIGCNAEKSFEDSLNELLSDSQFQHVEVRKAVADPVCYRLAYEKCASLRRSSGDAIPNSAR